MPNPNQVCSRGWHSYLLSASVAQQRLTLHVDGTWLRLGLGLGLGFGLGLGTGRGQYAGTCVSGTYE